MLQFNTVVYVAGATSSGGVDCDLIEHANMNRYDPSALTCRGNAGQY